MTPEDETSFREAARKALAVSRRVVMVSVEEGAPEELQPFAIVSFHNDQMVGIVVPDTWPDSEDDFCQSVLRQEEKALDGQPLD